MKRKPEVCFQRVDLMRKQRFKNIKPLAERITKETRIMMVGEFHGGTRAFSMDNILGTTKILERQAEEGQAPDMLVINGGILPTVPVHISRRNQDRMRFLAPGINTIEDAAVLVRPHIKRLLGHLDGDTRVVYVLGEEDRENMKFLKDEKISEMKSAKALAQKIDSLELERESLTSRFEAITHSQKVFEKRMEKIAQRLEEEELTEKEVAKLERHQNLLGGKAKKLAKESDKVRRRITAKNRQLTNLKNEAGQLGAVKRTKTERLTPEENRILDEEVKLAYFDLLRDIFQGAENLEIFDERVNVFKLNGITIGLGHNLSNTSTTAKKTELALKEYVQNKNELYRLLPPLDMLLFSHHPGTKCWTGPKKFGDTGVSVIFQQGSFADPKLISEAWNKDIKLPQTDSVNRFHFDSGATVITANEDGSFTFDLVGHQELKKGAHETNNEENRTLRKRLRGGINKFLKKVGKQNEEDESEIALQEGYLKSKLPSEMDDSLLAERIRLEVENGTDKRVIPDVLAPTHEVHDFDLVRVEVHSDTHIGSGNMLDEYSNYELLDACIEDSNERGLPDILVFGGDMVEGALGSKLNENVAKAYINPKEFMKRLDAMDELSVEDKMMARVEFMKRQNYSHPVTVVEEQVNRLSPLIKHAVDVVNAGGEVVLISGNHYNQSQKRENFDEATHLAKDIRLLGGFEDNHPRIHVFYGGWQGSGDVIVKGIPLFGIHKGKGSKDKITGLMDHRIQQKRPGFFYVEGHYHTPVFGKDLAGVFLSAPSIAPFIPFVDQAAIKAGLRGYTRMDFFVDSIGRYRFRARITNILQEQLKKHMDEIDRNYLKVLRDMFKQAR
jgi:hypothetical protein